MNKKELFRKKNVNGISQDDQLGECRVYVEKKEDEGDLDNKDLVPDYFDGYKTDVVEVGEITPIEPKEKRTKKFDTLQPGISIGHHEYTTAGTLGVFVERDNETFFLTNAHVGAGSNKAKKGDAIVQPGPADGGRLDEDKVGELEHYFPMKDGMKWNASLVKVTGRKVRHKPRGLSVTPRSVRNPDINESVSTTGRTAPTLSTSMVLDRGVDIMVNYDNKVEVLKTNVYEGFIQGGDSGSGIFADNGNYLVDIAFAGSDKYSFGIGNIVKLFDYYKISLPS